MADAVSLSDLVPKEQFCLSEISVFNWGSFDGIHTAKIDRDGTLITGSTGAGKSSLIDALQPLLLKPSAALFNVAAAQGEKNDRSLVTYVRGRYKGFNVETRDSGNLRDGSTISVVRAEIRAGDQILTMMGVFALASGQDSLSQVKRLYLIATRPLTIKEVHDRSSRFDQREIKIAYESDPSVTLYATFDEYQKVFMDRLYMTNPNAPALLCRVLGLKQIADLTHLIRHFVLDPREEVTERVNNALSNFNDLQTVYLELQDQRLQHETLAPLPALKDEIEKHQESLARAQAMRDAVPVYVGIKYEQRWRERKAELGQRKASLVETLTNALSAAEEANLSAKRAFANYEQAGGDRIRTIDQEIHVAKGRLQDAQKKASDYVRLMTVLSCDATLTQELFDTNQRAFEFEIQDADSASLKIAEQFAKAYGEQQRLKTRKDEIEIDLKDIRQRKHSNIDLGYQRIRELLAAIVGLSADDLVFIGELIAVRDGEEAWTGSVERALGGFKTRLIIPKGEALKEASKWLRQTNVRLDFRYEAFSPDSGHATFLDDGFLKKLDWRNHRYRDWLKRKLSNQDLHCVDSVEVLMNTELSINREGMIHYRGDSFRKNDIRAIDDRSDWQIGFSNERRVESLVAELRIVESSLTSATAEAARVNGARRGHSDRILMVQRVSELPWDAIDIEKPAVVLNALAIEKEQLQAGNDQLKLAKEHYDRTRLAESAANVDVKQRESEIVIIDTLITNADSTIAKFFAKASLPATLEARLDAGNLIGSLSATDLNDGEEIIARSNQLAGARVDQVTADLHKAEMTAGNILTTFRSKWLPIAADWGNEVKHSMGDYLAHFETVVKEKLHMLDERFRLQMNQRVFEQLNAIRNEIEIARDAITDRIDAINMVMCRTELNHGTFLKLKAVQQVFTHNKRFDEKIQQVLDLVTSDDIVTRFTTLHDVMEILKTAISPLSSHTLESRRLLDARYQFEFLADEIRKVDGGLKDSWSSSSGKSGGERESFSGMIVAASLAYVLTPQGHPKPVYSTVFLDEAFSNTSEVFGKRVINAFRELNLHLNLITPFKNINLARHSVNSIVMVDRPRDTLNSHLIEINWEYADRVLAQRFGQMQ